MKRFAVVLTLVVSAGCGQTALERAKVAGLATKQAAETAYLTVRVEYLLGQVDEETMEEARDLYARYAAAQQAYVAAIRLWETGRPPEGLDARRRRIADLAGQLTAIERRLESAQPEPPEMAGE